MPEAQEALVSQFCAVMPVESNSPARSRDCFAHRFGNAGDRPNREPRYPSDMSDTEWAVVRDVMPVAAWMNGKGGQPEGYCHRQMLDAVNYLVDNGQCRCLSPQAFRRDAAGNDSLNERASVDRVI